MITTAEVVINEFERLGMRFAMRDEGWSEVYNNATLKLVFTISNVTLNLVGVKCDNAYDFCVLLAWVDSEVVEIMKNLFPDLEVYGDGKKLVSCTVHDDDRSFFEKMEMFVMGLTWSKDL